MNATAEKSMNAALREAFPMPDRIRDLANMAHCDLWYGPYSAQDFAEECPERETQWPGFVSAVNEISEWAGQNVSECWYDEDCEGIMHLEPEGEEMDSGEVDEDGEPIMEWVEPEPYYSIERIDVLRALFGGELANYV